MTRKRSGSRKAMTITLSAAALVAAVVGLILYLPLHRENEAEEDLEADEVSLNFLLTNEDSDVEVLEGLDRDVRKYLANWEVKGASFAITRNDSLVYAKGYGKADEDVEMGPGNILRLASVSKLITACAVMKAAEEGLLSLDSQVFCKDGILCDSLYTSPIKDTASFKKITVEHLLRHQGGFSRDPMFSSLDVIGQMGLDKAPTQNDFTRLVLSRRLRFAPGEWQRYSNFGYMILSKVIEKVSGEKYEDYVREHVLKPAGCYDMHIAGNYYEDKRENEVRYYTHAGDGQYVDEYNGSGRIVERCYGGNNISALEGAGAWVASAVEIARLVASIDGDPTLPDILSSDSVAEMTEQKDSNTFAIGWNDTTPETGWVRTGTFSGTSALVKRYPDGECWILITNTSTWKGPRQAKYTSTFFTRSREKYSSLLPKVNLFEKK